MGEILKQRIRERLAALDLNPFEAAARAGQKREFIYDLIVDRKGIIREKSLPSVARALECDVDYLQGIKQTPRRVTELPLSGVCELDVWRTMEFTPWVESPMISPDERYLPHEQLLFYLADEHAAGIGLRSNTFIVVAAVEGLRRTGRRIHDGDIVLVKQDGGFKAYEYTLRAVKDTPSGPVLSTMPLLPTLSQTVTESENTAVIGLVLRSVLIFGLPRRLAS